MLMAISISKIRHSLKLAADRLQTGFRAFVYGRCPYCNSTRTMHVNGWNKRTCLDCHASWKEYEL